MTHDLLLVQYGARRSNKTLSPPCAKAQMALHLKGLEYRVHNCASPREVRRYNLRGRVPALFIDGEAIVDSFEILTELDRRFPDPPLEPADAAERARCRILEDWIDEVVYFLGAWTRWVHPEGFARIREVLVQASPFPLSLVIPTVARRMLRKRLLGQGTAHKPADVVLRELAEAYDRLEALAGAAPYLCGEQLTRADLAAAALLDQLDSSLTPPSLRQDMDERPALRTWLARVHEHVPNFAG